MSRSYFHRRHRQWHKTPPYWIRLIHTKPERRTVAIACKAVVQGEDPDLLYEKLRTHRPLDFWL